MNIKYVSILLFVVANLCTVLSDEDKKSNNNSLEEDVKDWGMSKKDSEVLKVNRLLVTDEAYKQIFSAYLSPGTFFITSDSLINAYHVLYEESILQLEYTKANQMVSTLSEMISSLESVDKNLSGNKNLIKASKERAKLVLGVALRLLDDNFKFNDLKLDGLLEAEIKNIILEEGIKKIDWLKNANGLSVNMDYSRFKPRGFYTNADLLKRYFRAVSWLQSIPFRLHNDEEFLSILMIRNTLWIEYEESNSVFGSYTSFLGSKDDWDIMTVENKIDINLAINLDEQSLNSLREKFKKENAPLISDFIRTNTDAEILEPNFRILSALRTPSAILFQKTTDIKKRPFPNGLEVLTALGSTFARKKLVETGKDDLVKTIDSCQKYFKGDSLYFQYLDALKVLLEKPTPESPDFMKGEGWQIKSANTVLAGWAQLSHTWVLQSKNTGLVFSAMRKTPPGFVEPVPEFYSRMASLAANTNRLLKANLVYEPENLSVIRQLETIKNILLEVKTHQEFEKKRDALIVKEESYDYFTFELMSAFGYKEEKASEIYFKNIAKNLDLIITKIKGGQLAKLQLSGDFRVEVIDLKNLWDKFERICYQMSIISHKQLRGLELNEVEATFIRSYGTTLAEIMLYNRTTCFVPKDDAPRIVDVFGNGASGSYLHAGIARARKIYVLYPWQGKTILCRGAIMPYYECVAPTRQTDESWKTLLDSKDRPAIPEWFAPIVSDKKFTVPKFKQD